MAKHPKTPHPQDTGGAHAFRPPPKSGPGKFILVGCLSIVIAGLLFLGIGGVYAWQNWRDLAADVVTRATDKQLHALNFSEEEHEQLMTRVETVATEYREKRIDETELKALGQAISKSPFLPMFIAKAAHGGYVVPSSLNEEEKARARLAFGRIAGGYVEGRISKDEIRELLAPISKDGSVEFKFSGTSFSTSDDLNLKAPGNVTSEELLALIEGAEQLASEKELSPEPLNINLAQELDRVIEETIKPAQPAGDVADAEPEPGDVTPLPDTQESGGS